MKKKGTLRVGVWTLVLCLLYGMLFAGCEASTQFSPQAGKEDSAGEDSAPQGQEYDPAFPSDISGTIDFYQPWTHWVDGFDELIGEQGEEAPSDRFAEVEKLEAMTPEERYAFWRGQLSRCIRCNACRNVCPACSCEKCVFDNAALGTQNKAAASFEENMFHIIRAFHVTARCTDCGECSRVCPQRIPLHLINRKLIKDINELYGEYQAGGDFDSCPPLMDFNKDDPEPSVVYARGGAGK